MNPEDRIAAFEKLGKYVDAIDEVELEGLVLRARNENSWFTKKSIESAFRGLCHFLKSDNLRHWLSSYSLGTADPKTIAVVMAGNIPMVGFHDLLCVLISGHNIMIKLSSKDTVLPTFLIEKLAEIERRFAPAINVVDRLKDFDAVIATGSDNSARYFEFYFGKYPHIIRKNRTSCAVLSGFEQESELAKLGEDVFTYFGLGCRNVSKIYVPEGYDFSILLKQWDNFADVMMHHKYHNNYDYQKSILLVNRQPFLDNGCILLQESEKMVSPIAVLYYEFYKDWDSLLRKLHDQQDKIQCVVGNVKAANVRIGQAQTPELWDYADQIDTMKFLAGLL
jgi:hypothetical protein